MKRQTTIIVITLLLVSILLISVNSCMKKEKEADEESSAADKQAEIIGEGIEKEESKLVSKSLITSYVHNIKIIDNEGKEILVCNDGQNYLLKKINNEYKQYGLFGAGLTKAATSADLENTGLRKIIIGNYNGETVIYSLEGNKEKVIDEKSYVEKIAVADLDNDGWDEIIIAKYTQPLKIVVNDFGKFEEMIELRSMHAKAVKTADLNNNGYKDIIVGTLRTNYIFYNKGNFEFDVLEIGDTRYHTHAIEIYDFDEDGELDIFFGNYDSPNEIFLQKNGKFEKTSQLFQKDYTKSTALIDFNKDGRKDILLGKYNEGIFVLINKGNGFFEEEKIYDKTYVNSVAVTEEKIFVGNYEGESIIIYY